MAIRMVSLQRSKSGSWSSRKVIPEDVREAYGRTEDKKTWSAALSTDEVRPLFAEWLRGVEANILELRSAAKMLPTPKPALLTAAPQSLSRSQQIKLRAEWLAWLGTRFGDLPDDTPQGWEADLERTEPHEPDAVPNERGRYAWTTTPWLQEQISQFLTCQSLILSHASMDEFRWQATDAYRDFCVSVIRYLNGDDTNTSPPASTRQSTPDLPATTIAPPQEKALALPEVSVLELMEGYLAERKPSPKSAKKFTGCINKLVEFVGHNDAHTISRTDILRWKDHLLGPAGLSSKTVKEGYLAAASVVLGWGGGKRAHQIKPSCRN